MICARCCVPDRVAWGLLERDAMAIDVMALHATFVRGARHHGAEIRSGEPVTAVGRDGDGWWVETGPGHRYLAAVVIDAAGAWGDVIASMAGVAPVGLTPRRRTAFTAPIGRTPAGWPLVHAHAGSASLPPCYFKPEGGDRLLCSLADEHPDDPGDARPREIDVARAIENVNHVTTLDIRSVDRPWAGLRTFAPDRELVIGFDPDHAGFFWLVGQGGTGIQTAPAAGALVAALVTDAPPPIDPTMVAVERLRPP